MSLNPVTCGNCGTENPPDQDVCINCELPLTRSGAEAQHENLEAQDRDGFLGAGGTAGMGAQPTAPGLGLGTADRGILPPR